MCSDKKANIKILLVIVRFYYILPPLFAQSSCWKAEREGEVGNKPSLLFCVGTLFVSLIFVVSVSFLIPFKFYLTFLSWRRTDGRQ